MNPIRTTNNSNPNSMVGQGLDNDPLHGLVLQAKEDLSDSISLKDLKGILPVEYLKERAQGIEGRVLAEIDLLNQQEAEEARMLKNRYVQGRNAVKEKYYAEFQRVKALLERLSRIQ